MRQVEVEAWAYRLIESAESTQKVEDARSELKSNWPEAQAIARQLAGHANAAYGQPILWLLGVSETSGVVPYETRDMADWRAQLDAEFEGVAPGMVHYSLRWKDQSFEALLFRTDAPPYVVKNPKRGKENAGPFEFEVPWRDGRTRSARRAELILMLRPVWEAPTFDCVGARIQLLTQRLALVSGYLYLFTPELRRVLVRSVSGSATFGDVVAELPNLKYGPVGADPDVVATKSHVQINGAGKIMFQGESSVVTLPDPLPAQVTLTLSFQIVGAPQAVAVPIVVPSAELDGSTTHAIGLWKLGEQ